MTTGNNDNGNIIPFPNPDEVVEFERESVAQITIYNDASVKVWVSYDVDDEEKVEWLKRQAGESLATLFNYLNGIEEGETYEGPSDE